MSFFDKLSPRPRKASPSRVPTPLECVHRQLDDDYPAAALAWVAECQWSGPERVPLDELDYSGMRDWKAFREEDKVRSMADRIDRDWEKPMIVVRRPGMAKAFIADGHHRALAYLRLGRAPLAYVAHAPKDTGGWDTFHSKQHPKERH